ERIEIRERPRRERPVHEEALALHCFYAIYNPGNGTKVGSIFCHDSPLGANISSVDLIESRIYDFGPANIASASIVISTMSPTMTPPLSRTPFQFTPKSWRLMVVFATNPARIFGPLSTPSSHHGVSHCPK